METKLHVEVQGSGTIVTVEELEENTATTEVIKVAWCQCSANGIKYDHRYRATAPVMVTNT